MHRLQLHYTLSRDSSPAQVRNPLIDLLQAVSSQGSISGGARALGLSYRHVWGELKRWEQELGNELLVWEKGQAARLTDFGAKLMWAERQAQARLAPQIEALRAELERSFALAFDDQVHMLTLYASHDEAISALREYALRDSEDTGRLHLDVRFTGSVDAIRALNEGRCVMAGFHTLLDTSRHSRSERSYKPLLQPGLHKIIGFARRTQGLMVAPGNPLALRAITDVITAQARFANRALGSGTRVVLDELLDQAGLTGAALPGDGRVEPSHAAVAQAVASGQCDTGLGIAAAAYQAGLDFVPLVEERYHLVCLKSALEQPGVQHLRQLLQTPHWQAHVGAIAGYAPEQSGQVLSMRKVLPWWNFAQKKAAAPTAGPATK
ncbi:substrate-binding domain-containing protein [Rhodoferax sp.]|uniref:helix-turn-helix transcriptional regulator n=1 Tax=Rhodoferax sp. TaxID=50421 RepID=UPI00262EA113|nr:substrate-binding domain-containing protein [Rhodoferax sp.]MDD2925063.1 substrate-binding domain-containing protein [Rhodoferax sp.]